MDDQGLDYQGYMQLAGKEFRDIIGRLTTELKTQDADSTDIRMFFPKGIERIFFEVSIGPKDKPIGLFSIEVAGAAGVKTKSLELPVASPSDTPAKLEV